MSIFDWIFESKEAKTIRLAKKAEAKKLAEAAKLAAEEEAKRLVFVPPENCVAISREHALVYREKILHNYKLEKRWDASHSKRSLLHRIVIYRLDVDYQISLHPKDVWGIGLGVLKGLASKDSFAHQTIKAISQFEGLSYSWPCPLHYFYLCGRDWSGMDKALPPEISTPACQLLAMTEFAEDSTAHFKVTGHSISAQGASFRVIYFWDETPSVVTSEQK